MDRDPTDAEGRGKAEETPKENVCPGSHENEPVGSISSELFYARFREVATGLSGCTSPEPSALQRAASDLIELAERGAPSPAIRAALVEAAQILSACAAGTCSDPDADLERFTNLMDGVAASSGPRARKKRKAPEPEPEPEREPEPAPAPSPPTLPSAPCAVSPEANRALLIEFVTECREYLEGAEEALLALESDPDQTEAINSLFRTFHTIKGTSGFMRLDLITELAHKAENVLSRIRDKEIRCTGGYADLTLRAIDCMKALIEGIMGALDGEPLEKPTDYDDLLRTLIDPAAAGVTERMGEPAGERTEAKPSTAGPPRSDAGGAGPGAPPKAHIGSPAGSAGSHESHASDGSVRVRTERLDRLIDIVGELVIAHSMVAQATASSGQSHDLLRKVTHAGKIVRELQDLSMSLRMVPLKPTFQKMARLARDVAHKFGREVTFTTAGEDTEIDRNMVDLLADPLIHMVRNAVDHGLEPPEERVAGGKPKAGSLQLSAYHAGGTVVVEVRDDGRGIDREQIARKAIARGMIESDKGMSDADVFACIFEPGFSTAGTVTEVSGRGVGLDVVRRAVESLHGRIDIRSEKGTGTTFRVKVPLTLAVTDGMLIRVGAERYIVPTASIRQTLRPEPSNLYTVVGRGEMLTLRGELMPIIRLHRVFDVPGAIEDPVNASLVLVDDGEREFAVMVDELLGQQQVVAKALSGAIERLPGLAGAAILGDGRVGLILDPRGLMGLLRSGGGAGRIKAPPTESLVG